MEFSKNKIEVSWQNQLYKIKLSRLLSNRWHKTQKHDKEVEKLDNEI